MDPISGTLTAPPLHGCVACHDYVLPLRDGSSPLLCPACGPVVCEDAPGRYTVGSFTHPTTIGPYRVDETGAVATCSCWAWRNDTGCKHLTWVQYLFDCGCIGGQSRGVVHSSIIPPIRPLQTIPPVAA